MGYEELAGGLEPIFGMNNYVHLISDPGGNSSVFSRVLMFPETKSRETSGLEGKQN